MKPVSIGVLGVQGDIEEHDSALKQAYAEMKLDGKVTWVKTTSQAETIHGLIIPGGESTTIGRLAENKAVSQALQNRIEKGLPTLGTCAGLIMLANKTYDRVVGETKQPFIGGLDIVVERNAFGRQRESFEADLSIQALGPEPFRGVFIRSPVVKQVGPKVETLSRLNEKVVAVRQGNVLGTSFHPELSGDSRFHEYFVQLVAKSPLLQ